MSVYPPPLNGLVLAGGYSTRMGEDKGMIKWHGIEQRYYLAHLMKEFCDEVFISCREEQATSIDSNYKTLIDQHANIGPMSGILSALEFQPHKAWLIVACDMPLIDKEVLKYLVENRNTNKFATAYLNQEDNSPEPLICIWEPACIYDLKDYVNKGKASPRQFLTQHSSELLSAPHPEKLMNANTPEDAEKIKAILNSRQ